jgi:hypothetical protein
MTLNLNPDDTTLAQILIKSQLWTIIQETLSIFNREYQERSEYDLNAFTDGQFTQESTVRNTPGF